MMGPLTEARSGVAPDGSPVALYLALPGEAEAAFIHSVIPPAAAILELGCGAGRVTRSLAALGHHVAAVDHGPEMLDEIRDLQGVEPILADIVELDLAPRRWPVVLLASHLINDENGERFLQTAADHVEPDGCILVQRHEPGWIDTVTESTSRRPGLTIDMRNIQHSSPGVLTATMVYEVGADRFEQTFTAYEMADERLRAVAASAGCEVDEILDTERKWARIRPARSDHIR